MDRLTIRGNDGKAYIRALDPDCTCNQNCPRLWDHFWMLVDRIAAYEDAEEDGRLVVLPCKVGDAAYWVHNGVITDCRVNRIQLNRAGLFICLRSKVSHGAFSVRCIGKSVFFSRREAEASMKGGDD